MENLGVEGKIIFEESSENLAIGNELVSSGSEELPVLGFCEHDNELSDSVEDGEHPDQLSDSAYWERLHNGAS